MHVLMVSEFFPPITHGGGETSALALAKALAKNGQRVSVLTSRAEGLPEKNVTEGVMVIRTLGTGKTSNSFAGNIKRLGITASIKKELPKLIDELKPDVLHALNITSMPGVAAVAREKGIPAVAHINSPLAFDPKGTLTDNGKERETPYSFGSFVASFLQSESTGRLANPWYLRYNPIAWCVFYRRWTQIRDSFAVFDHFFPISKTMQRWLMKYGVPIEKTTVVPNIVPIADAKQIKTNKIPHLFFDGGYAPLKGLPVVIDALRSISQKYELHAVGEGVNRATMKEQAKNAQVNVVFHGFVSESEHLAFVAKSDIVLFPSLVPEGLGRLVLIAMAAGKPVIASRIGGMTETVVEGRTGLLVEPGNVAAWRTAIRSLLSDAKKRKKLGMAGRERFEREYSAASIVKKVMSGYHQVFS